jgi:hypothetical protein
MLNDHNRVDMMIPSNTLRNDPWPKKNGMMNVAKTIWAISPNISATFKTCESCKFRRVREGWNAMDAVFYHPAVIITNDQEK